MTAPLFANVTYATSESLAYNADLWVHARPERSLRYVSPYPSTTLLLFQNGALVGSVHTDWGPTLGYTGEGRVLVEGGSVR